MRVPFILAFACLALAGCAGMSAEECRTSNWFDVGFRDGLAGMQRRDITYEYQCGQQGVAPDSRAYLTGWQDGKWEFEKRSVRDSTD
jgi:hypothetical protein